LFWGPSILFGGLLYCFGGLLYCLVACYIVLGAFYTILYAYSFLGAFHNIDYAIFALNTQKISIIFTFKSTPSLNAGSKQKFLLQVFSSISYK
jgi:hypothetical protein